MFSWLRIFTATEPCWDTDGIVGQFSSCSIIVEEATLTVHIKLCSCPLESISPTLLAFNLQIQNTTRSSHMLQLAERYLPVLHCFSPL